jgi:hypothetical protein
MPRGRTGFTVAVLAISTPLRAHGSPCTKAAELDGAGHLEIELGSTVPMTRAMQSSEGGLCAVCRYWDYRRSTLAARRAWEGLACEIVGGANGNARTLV